MRDIKRDIKRDIVIWPDAILQGRDGDIAGITRDIVSPNWLLTWRWIVKDFFLDVRKNAGHTPYDTPRSLWKVA